MTTSISLQQDIIIILIFINFVKPAAINSDFLGIFDLLNLLKNLQFKAFLANNFYTDSSLNSYTSKNFKLSVGARGYKKVKRSTKTRTKTIIKAAQSLKGVNFFRSFIADIVSRSFRTFLASFIKIFRSTLAYSGFTKSKAFS